MKPTIGRIVLYRLTNDDVDEILDLAAVREKHFNSPNIGDLVPAVIVKINQDDNVNIKAILDGEADLWIMKVHEGLEEGEWQWPTIEEKKPSGYQMSYSRLFGLPNFENEKIEITRNISANVDSVEALKALKAEVLGIRKKVALDEEEQLKRYNQLLIAVTTGECQMAAGKREMERLAKALNIKPDDEQVTLTEKGAAAAAKPTD